MKVCTACRRKASRHARYLKQKERAKKEAARNARKLALQEQRKLLNGSELSEAMIGINRELSRVNYKIDKYMEKVSLGMATKRTENAIAHQSRRKDYFEEIKLLLMKAAGQGIYRPLEYYLSNTYLLHKHGFPCVVVDADPYIELENNDADH